MKLSIPADVERAVKRAFNAKKPVCGCKQWSQFASEARRLAQAGSVDQYLARAKREAEEAVQPQLAPAS